MIYSQLNRPETVPTNPGTQYINTYQEELDKEGKLTLVKTGEHNVYLEIQEDAEDSKIENILHRAAMGDLNALNQREVAYMDATTMPKNLKEMQNEIIKFKDEFYEMPLEVRQLFNNSPEMYVSEMGTQEFLDKMAPYNAKIEAISKEKSDKEYRKKVAEGAQLNIDIEKEQARLKGEANE